MRIYDIISHKRDGLELTDDEIAFFVKGVTEKTIEDYQCTALLMAIYLNGMSDREMITLTDETARSGDMLDLSAVGGVTADKHSTGGVGDKTTLIVAPIAAALGVKIAKMSGRGLGHTGGTVDKLESIDGFCTSLSPERFISQVQKIGIAVVGQTGSLAPADKILYSLRDATATVASLPLIASSIMSKKLAAGASCIVLDVKTGSGAFMKTVAQAKELSEKMVHIGNAHGRKTAALITDMDTPLGNSIGNSLEVKEAIEVLSGRGPADLTEVSSALAAKIVSLSFGISKKDAEAKVKEALANGTALSKLREMVEAQGGDVRLIDNPELFKKARFCRKVLSPEEGYIKSMNAEKIGASSVILGAGREKKGDPIDFSAGIILHKKTGDKVKIGGELCELLTDDEAKLHDAEKLFISAIEFCKKEPEKKPLILCEV